MLHTIFTLHTLDTRTTRYTCNSFRTRYTRRTFNKTKTRVTIYSTFNRNLPCLPVFPGMPGKPFSPGRPGKPSRPKILSMNQIIIESFLQFYFHYFTWYSSCAIKTGCALKSQKENKKKYSMLIDDELTGRPTKESLYRVIKMM